MDGLRGQAVRATAGPDTSHHGAADPARFVTYGILTAPPDRLPACDKLNSELPVPFAFYSYKPQHIHIKHIAVHKHSNVRKPGHKGPV